VRRRAFDQKGYSVRMFLNPRQGQHRQMRRSEDFLELEEQATRFIGEKQQGQDMDGLRKSRSIMKSFACSSVSVVRWISLCRATDSYREWFVEDLWSPTWFESNTFILQSTFQYVYCMTGSHEYWILELADTWSYPRAPYLRTPYRGHPIRGHPIGGHPVCGQGVRGLHWSGSLESAEIDIARSLIGTLKYE
jgi:hypothetical protein